MSYAFVRGLDYAAAVATSERVAWTVGEVFAGRRFDPWRAIVPDAWVGADALSFLDARALRTLNHCRAFSYVHLLGNFEEFAPLHLADVVQSSPHDDRARVRSLFRFGEEELKHQQLFARAERVLEESCGHAFGRYFSDDKSEVTVLSGAILEHHLLARLLLVLALEWGTQRHYVESRTEQCGDPLYADILKAHWIEEAQHGKWGTLEIARLAATMRPGEIAAALDDLNRLGGLVDAVFTGQVEKEIDTLTACTERSWSALEREALRTTLHASLSGILAGVGLSHPSFVKVMSELAEEGVAMAATA